MDSETENTADEVTISEQNNFNFTLATLWFEGDHFQVASLFLLKSNGRYADKTS